MSRPTTPLAVATTLIVAGAAVPAVMAGSTETVASDGTDDSPNSRSESTAFGGRATPVPSATVDSGPRWPR